MEMGTMEKEKGKRKEKNRKIEKEIGKEKKRGQGTKYKITTMHITTTTTISCRTLQHLLRVPVSGKKLQPLQGPIDYSIQ